MAINDLLQYVQDAYASLTELSIMIVDSSGNPVTKVSNMTELAELVLFVAKKRASSFFCPEELAVDGWRRPAVVPAGHLGMKSIMAPVFVDGRAEYWIWAGVFIEEETKWLICEQPVSDAREWTAALEQADALPARAIEAKLNEIEKMAAICGELIGGERRKQRYNEYGQLLKTAVTDRAALNGADKLLHQLRKMDERLDMALYIEKCQQGWVVAATSGGKAGQLYGKMVDELFPPLSFLEPPLYPAYFQDAALDPRFSFFVRHGIRPKAMIVYPAVYGRKAEGWVVVGSETASSLPEAMQPLGAALVQYGHLLARCAAADAKMDRHFMRLSMLIEIGRAMRVVQQEEEIVRMMAEFAIELAYGDFVCAILCGGKAVTVHEGAISDEMASCYRDDVLRRYGRGIEQVAKNQVPALRQVGDKTVMEVPFFVRDGHYGVLAVHLKETDEAKEAEVYMTALVSVGVMMMNGAAQGGGGQAVNVQMLSEQLTAREMDVLELLVQGCSNREISERLFISVHTVKNHITNIFQKIGVNDRSQLIALVYQLSHRRQRH
ncbi:LuxR family transcriptional regulator [Geobacillus subterraneus]|uniref:LuxR family transcriptional regulator n=2 Tax=Geobacillus TaxID=129337 RepID=A0ABN4NIV8_9BACL|nr:MULTISPECIES: helix-turn-helix transcriptional regulator [Geobacillus]AMX84639.1 LuxR family transcriptional regulator [Geobacillus subterraneus]KZS24841.1 LuxR family transcriptional regulator [Geobacillus subterraneus]OXB85461.1 LuxR family transcriptional regulator [Geobacillus uzenensis]